MKGHKVYIESNKTNFTVSLEDKYVACEAASKTFKVELGKQQANKLICRCQNGAALEYPARRDPKAY